MHRHLRFYNDPYRYTAIKDDHPRFQELEKGAKTFEDIDIVFDAPPKTEIGGVLVEKSQDGRGHLLVLDRPAKFVGKGKASEKGGEEPIITGEIDFGLHVSIAKEEVDGRSMWTMRLGRK